MTDDKRIDKAKLDWGEKSPRSVFFDDIYFSGDGPAETDHVFLRGNDLPKRFNGARHFSVGELGFGTGLNFLCLWDCWRRLEKPADARLHFFSLEAFPLSLDDLERALSAWPNLAALSQQLVGAYPPAHPGFHRMYFDDGVTLTLFFGDALEGLNQVEGAFDAWFLDGFSPDKNPAMWRPELMNDVARLTKTEGTFATFTVAGAVRRALLDAGFEIEKRPGYGRKREMLAGRRKAHSQHPIRQPWFDARSRSQLPPNAKIAVIGAGIAGASVARALMQAGFAPIVYEAEAPASGASGNPAGLIMPRLDADKTPIARFHVSAYLHAVRLLTDLQAQSSGLFATCGVTLQATDDKERARQEKALALNVLPEGWARPTAEGLQFPQGGVVDPAAFVRRMLGDATIRNEKVARLHNDEDQWRVVTESGATELFDGVVIANGLDALRFAQARSLPLKGSQGQIDYFPHGRTPQQAWTFGSYAAPAPQGGLVIGATYEPVTSDTPPQPSEEASQRNLESLRNHHPDLVHGLEPDQSAPRAAIRCTTPDKLPVAGPMPDWGFYAGAYDGLRTGRRAEYPRGEMQKGLYILSGLGSRGLVTAPLTAALLAAEIAGAPAPLGFDVAEALHPARFFIRDLKRSK